MCSSQSCLASGTWGLFVVVPGPKYVIQDDASPAFWHRKPPGYDRGWAFSLCLHPGRAEEMVGGPGRKKTNLAMLAAKATWSGFSLCTREYGK